jgi:hypothetical protein
MGKSKGGGGAEGTVATSNIATLVARRLADEKREPSVIKVQRVTTGLFSVDVTVHGEQEPEAYFISVNDE